MHADHLVCLSDELPSIVQEKYEAYWHSKRFEAWSVDKTTDSQSWGPRFESAGSGSTALGQGTSSWLPSPSEMT